LGDRHQDEGRGFLADESVGTGRWTAPYGRGSALNHRHSETRSLGRRAVGPNDWRRRLQAAWRGRVASRWRTGWGPPIPGWRGCMNRPLDRSLWSRLGGGVTLNQWHAEPHTDSDAGGRIGYSVVRSRAARDPSTIARDDTVKAGSSSIARDDNVKAAFGRERGL